jgi:cysteine sulfinate desulfinase/cysteine desulfurase-like protein
MLAVLADFSQAAFAIYLDHNATTPILPEVLEAMMPYLTTEWGDRRAERRSAWASAVRLRSPP